VRTTAELDLPDCTPAALFEHVADLDRYPPWMRLVHRVERVERPDEERPVWDVELRGRLGPLARSKRLRMMRTVYEPGRRARFERVETDGRDVAEWELDARVEATDDGARLVMELGYGGELWGSGVLRRVLDDEIRRGRAALRTLVNDPAG